MNQNKIVPNLWFNTSDGTITKVLEYYKHIFNDDFQHGSITALGQTPSGHTELCEVQIFGQKYVFMSTELEHHALNDAVSFIIYCEDQNEIDKLWNYFTEEGQAVQCGWCIDKFGLRWQVLPENLAELMSRPNSFQVMLKQTKIVIEEYLK